MSDWIWVAAGYITAYGVIIGYAISLRRRTAQARCREAELDHPTALEHAAAPDRRGPVNHPASVDHHEAGRG